MTYGNQGRAKRSWMRAVRCTVAIALAALLAWGQVPPAAWAEAADSISAAVSDASGSQAPGTESEQEGGLESSVQDAGDDAGQPAAPDGADGAAGDATESGDIDNGSADGKVQAVGSMASTSDSSSEEGSAADGTASDDAGSRRDDGGEQQVAVTVAVYGQSSRGDVEEWLAPYEIELDGDKTAEDAIVQALDENDIEYYATPSEYGLYFQTITSPFDADNTLGWDGSNFWQFLVDGSSASAGAAGVPVSEGASYAMVFGSSGVLPSMVSVSFEVYGTDAQGNPDKWVSTDLAVEKGTTAAELTQRILDEEGFAYSGSTSQDYGWSLDSVTSTDGRELSLQQVEGEYLYWQFWVNGSLSNLGSSSVEINDDATVSWYYAAWGMDYPENGVVADPDAPRPDWEGTFGFAQGATDAATPVGEADSAWTAKLKDSSDYRTNVSGPLVAHGFLYICAGSQLIMMDASTGSELGRASLVEPIDSISRMVMVDGLIIVPLHDGRLQALTADTLKTVWFTDALPAHAQGGAQQFLGSLTVSGDYLYCATASAGWTDSYNGYVLCVDIRTGEVVWKDENPSCGYYWAGAAVSGGWAVIVDDAGQAKVYDASTGEVASTLSLSAGARSQVVNGTEAGTFIVVTRDGRAHKLALDDKTGEIIELASVSFGSSSTSTPAIVDGKIFVGGSSTEGYETSWGVSYYGVLAVIDEQTMTVDYAISRAGGEYIPADVKASPLVSQQAGATYVYFTCNSTPGGIYCYRVGDGEAELIYTPEKDGQNYCMASIVCGADGTLYYTNDSGKLFAVKAARESTPGGGEPGTGAGDANGPAGGNGGSENGSGSKTGSGSQATRTSLRTSGAVSPAARPVSADGSTDASASSDEQGEAVETASASSSSASAASAAASRTEVERGGIPQWAPVAGIVVGVCGLAAIGAYLTALRKRG